MKAILVVDMPKNCDECRLNIEGICSATNERVYSISCPLRPMPEKEQPMRNKEGSYFRAYDTGWNDCLDEIMGEEK